MRRAGILVAVAAAVLVVVAVLVPPPLPYRDPGPNGYRIAARYFRADTGPLRRGLDLLLSAAPQGADWQRVLAAARGGDQILIPASPENLLALGVRGIDVPAPQNAARPVWPDPATGGVGRMPLTPGAACLARSGLPPIVASGSCIVLTFLPEGRGGFWIIGDPAFFANAGITLHGHLQILTNLVHQAGGMTFATWPPTPPPPASAAPTPASRWLLALLPAAVLLFWVAGSRFGPVRRLPRQDPDPDPARGLAHLLRRHQAGRVALAAVLERERSGIPPDLGTAIEARIHGPPLLNREAVRWHRRMTGGQSDGRGSPR